ncbi:3136_t:CDS:2 [Ambispora leptoticha]|uniref:3136_t:CDS:1 n=1 Tax=Ambispora leptoticha TaxID=144679 RepID=A0A9N8VV43_9GLOM|nr:3136_t:CDS:2 [Ambispora leptoticha]
MAARGGINAKGESAPQPVKVQRYWPGKVPEGAKDYYSSEEEDEEQQQFEKQKERELISSIQRVDFSEREVASDRRLRRLQEAREDASHQPIDRRRRHEVKTEITETQVIEEDTSQDVEDENDIALRRKLIRNRAIEQRRIEEEKLKAEEEAERTLLEKKEESESEYTTEYETDSEEEEEEEDLTARQLKKPVFIPKAHRETMIEKERLEKEAEEAERKRIEEIENRKKETHAILAEKIQKQMLTEVKDEQSTLKEVDDTDGIDEQAEYEAWKLRELKRIKRDKEERRAEKEQEEIERRRNMSEEQRLKEDMERVRKQQEEKPRGKYKFLQKYYHKGAFYLDPSDSIYKRDYTEATPDEAAHKELLPKVMQVKNFGRAGQTKWTHLADQDTSKKDSAWSQKNELNKRSLHKLAGLHHGGFDKPTAKKRKL